MTANQRNRSTLLIFGLIAIVCFAVLALCDARAEAAESKRPGTHWTIYCETPRAVSELVVVNRSDHVREFTLTLTEANFGRHHDTITNTRRTVLLGPGKAHAFTQTLRARTDWAGVKIRRPDGGLVWSDDYVSPVWDCL